MLETTKNSLKGIGLQFFAEEPTVETQPNQPSAQSQPSTEQSAPENKSYTQEQLNSMMAHEKRTARQALLKELGYDPKDDKSFKDAMAEIKKTIDSGKTQQQLDKEAKQQAEDKLREAEAKNSRLELKVAALAAGVKSDVLDDVITLASSKIDENNTIDKVLTEFKTKYPTFFGEGNTVSGTGNPTNPPRKGNIQEGMGKRLAQTNKTTTKSNYFHN